MSTNNTEKTNSTFPIVGKIKALLNLGEEGKLISFFTRVKKTLEFDIKTHKNNLISKKSTYEQKLEELEYQLEDRKGILDEVFLNVDLEQIKTNEDQKNYMDVYLRNIGIAERDVKATEDCIATLKDKYKDEVDEINESIKDLESKIETILG